MIRVQECDKLANISFIKESMYHIVQECDKPSYMKESILFEYTGMWHGGQSWPTLQTCMNVMCLSIIAHTCIWKTVIKWLVVPERRNVTKSVLQDCRENSMLTESRNQMYAWPILLAYIALQAHNVETTLKSQFKSTFLVLMLFRRCVFSERNVINLLMLS